MKKLLFITLALLCHKIIAQEFQMGKYNQKLEIELEKQQKLIVTSNVTPLIMHASHISFDSLKTQFETLKKLLPEKISPLNSATYLLNYDLKSKKPLISVIQHKSKGSTYLLDQEDDLSAVRTGQDSVIFSFRYNELPKEIFFIQKYKSKLPDEWLTLSYCFVLNTTDNLAEVDSDFLVNQIKNKIDKISSKVNDAGLYGNPEMKIESGADQHLEWDYKTQDFLALTGRASGGWIREKFVPEIGLNAELILKGKFGIGVGVNQFFHFQNPQSENFKVRSSTFINLSFSPRKFVKDDNSGMTFGKVTSEFMGSFSVGYMIRDNSGFFPKNTWRVSGTFPVMNHLYVEPEIFFNDAFKRIYPGIRIKIM